MNYKFYIKEILENSSIYAGDVREAYSDEVHIKASPDKFSGLCLGLHKLLRSPVMMLFASDERMSRGVFTVTCVFMSTQYRKWFFVSIDVRGDDPRFDSLAKNIYSATFFEREIKEMFGIEPVGHPDLRRLNLHDEVWPEGHYPLRKDFKYVDKTGMSEYAFKRIEGEGVFEVPVGPVHAGIIGPGHFRFSVAGEPIINLETRLGFTHKGVEKIMEGRSVQDALKIAECVSGDTPFGHSLAFCNAVEKICGVSVPNADQYSRAVLLELERMYNHVADIGGIALDAGFTFPSAYASIIKESILALNQRLTGHRYLKNVNNIGGLAPGLLGEDRAYCFVVLGGVENDFKALKSMILSSVSFMDRVDSTGILKKKTAEDLGVVGVAARASGISMDLRKDFPGAYNQINFKVPKYGKGDVLARLMIRAEEFEESIGIIRAFLRKIDKCEKAASGACPDIREGSGLGYAEGWRGAILYWVKLDSAGKIGRCKIVDPSFHNWNALTFAVLGNIIPDFPLCNKSFDLSYSGNDL